MSNKFKVGDVAQLNSGGALMTVEGYSSLDDKLVSCVWHDKNKHFRETYHEDTLAKDDPSDHGGFTV